MESIQDRFNAKLNSLGKMKMDILNLYEEFEKQRMLTVSEARNMERSAKENCNREVAETCKTAQEILDELRLRIGIVQNMPIANDESNRHRGQERKCRYYNRGYCKFDGDCKFRHSELICEEYLRDCLLYTSAAADE